MKPRRFFESLYRVVLRVFPLEFREEYGDEMKLAAREQAREGAIPALSSSLKDLFIHAPREHWQMAKQDTTLALRTWRKAPGVPSAAIFALALGIGVSTAMFSIVYAVMLRPLAGVAVGTVSALLVTDVLDTLLYRVQVRDPFIFAAVPSLFLICGLSACLLPSLRASRVDPMVCLRSE